MWIWDTGPRSDAGYNQKTLLIRVKHENNQGEERGERNRPGMLTGYAGNNRRAIPMNNKLHVKAGTGVSEQTGKRLPEDGGKKQAEGEASVEEAGVSRTRPSTQKRKKIEESHVFRPVPNRSSTKKFSERNTRGGER